MGYHYKAILPLDSNFYDVRHWCRNRWPNQEKRHGLCSIGKLDFLGKMII